MKKILSDKQKTAHEKKENVKSLIIAVFVSVAMWFIVSVQDRIEAQVDINVDYVQIPQNLIVTEGLISKITVRLKGPEKLIRSIPRDNVVHTVNLSSIKKGVTIVPISTDILGPAFRAFDIVDIQPPRILVKADNLIERSVSIRAVVDSPLRGDALTVDNISVNPATVILRGPESILSGMSSLPLTITLDPKEVGKSEPRTQILDTPGLVTANPPAVRVRYTVTSGRTIINRQCPVEIDDGDAGEYELSPKEISLVVEVPEALSKSAQYLRQLQVTVLPPEMEPGQTIRLKPRVRLPEGMVILNQIETEISVTRKQ